MNISWEKSKKNGFRQTQLPDTYNVFLKQCREVSSKRLKFFIWMSKDNKNSSRANGFPQVIAPLDTKDAASKTPVKFLHENVESFLLNIKSSWENSDKKRISWDSSPWNLDCNFDNPAEKIPTKGPIVLAQCAKIVRKIN